MNSLYLIFKKNEYNHSFQQTATHYKGIKQSKVEKEIS